MDTDQESCAYTYRLLVAGHKAVVVAPSCLVPAEQPLPQVRRPGALTGNTDSGAVHVVVSRVFMQPE